MSSKLIKQPGLIDLPNDEVELTLVIWKSGKRKLEAPRMHPTEVCKLLYGTITDVTFMALTPQDLIQKAEVAPKEETRIVQ